MKTTTSLFSFQQQGRLKATQQGMTLIEVLISMFVLAIGILALLSVQLRAVSSVREGETQTIVSQITQNLIEGMLINPVLSAETDSSGAETGRMLKSYSHYLIDNSQNVNGSYKDNGQMTKQELATAQIASFSNALSTALPDAKFHFAICRDSSGREPTYEGSFNARCNNSGDTIVKVLWLIDAEEEQNGNDLKSSGNFIVYTHQSRVTE
ncbi:type IV pilus modification protein PilV [Neisseria yangbaofengii]|uniref:type IV pilus modification protein PilV n=1 Tax=Neisseria yangbaofengii TaxID=2709396 RepID=UPI001868BE37|nr:type IV pilus modification protein PilV [Neisseria yangbaofengii]